MNFISAFSFTQDFRTSSFCRVLIVGVIAVCSLISFLALSALEYHRKQVMDAAEINLEGTLFPTHERLDLWFNQNKAMILELNNDQRLVSLTTALLGVKEEKDTLVNSPELAAIRNFLKSKKNILGDVGFFIISKNRISIASRRDENVGSINLIEKQRPELLMRVFAGDTVFIPPIHSDIQWQESSESKKYLPTTFIAAPIFDVNNNVIAAIAKRIDPRENFSHVLHTGQFSESGEIYAIDNNGLLLSESRFNDQLKKIGLIETQGRSSLTFSIRDPGENLLSTKKALVDLNERPLTLMAEKVINHQMDTNLEGYRDYRGISVIGAGMWDPTLGIGLIAEIDKEEALAPYYHLRTAVGISLALLALFAMTGTYLTIQLGKRASFALQKARDTLTTQKTESEEQLRLFAEIISRTNAAIFVIDAETARFIRVNEEACKSLGYSEKELLELTLYDIENKIFIDESSWQGHVEDYMKNSVYIEGVHHRKDNTVFPVELAISVVESNGKRFVVTIAQDITVRKETFKALNIAMNEADAASQAKSDFLANMSHEIRTPMNAIISLSGLCLNTELNSKQRDYIEKVYDSGQSLLGIINDILDFSKIEAGKLEMESIPFSLDKVLEDLAGLTAQKAQEKGIELVFDVPDFRDYQLIGDPLRLGQILLNLLTNAIKFTEQGEIIVKVEALEMRVNNIELQVTVSDTGVGLTEEQRRRLFTSFSQADTSTTRQYGGSGLGLAICKNLVGRMDGDISATSELGKGSSFKFNAKFGWQRITSSDTSSVFPSALQNLKTLVVDDVDSAREMTKNVLQSFKFDVNLASSGAEAIQMLENSAKSHPYGLVVIDWKMPGMDGLETTKRIKENPVLANLPVILVSGFESVDLDPYEEKYQPDGFCPKPFTSSHLFDNIMKVFDHASASNKKSRKAWGISSIESLRDVNVLVVDDNKINQQIAVELLTNAGLKVSLANNGKEGVEKIKSHLYDVVLMDVQMPVMDGYQATKEVRRDPAYSDLPIIAMTANAMTGDKEKCIQAGMNEHVAKPINPNILFETLLHWVKPKEKVDVHSNAVENSIIDINGDGNTDYKDVEEIDIEAGIARVGGKKEFYFKLLSDFYADHENDLKLMDEAITDGDVNKAQRIIHTLKGISGSLGAEAFQIVAKDVDGILKEENIQKYKEYFPKLTAEFKLLISEIKQLIETNELEMENQIKGNSKEVYKMIENLKTMIKDMNPDAEDQAEKLSVQLNEKDSQKLAMILVKQVSEFEFDEANDTLQQIQTKMVNFK